MNLFDLNFLHYLQEHAPVSILDATEQCQRTESAIKRSIVQINKHLTPPYFVSIDNQNINTNFGYAQYIKFINSLSINDYLSRPIERIEALITMLCLTQVVNKNQFYNQLHISETTIKNDKKRLDSYLKVFGLTLHILPKKGSEIVGSESSLRIVTSLIILKTVEITADNYLEAHKANPPLRRIIAEQFLTHCQEDLEKASKTYLKLSKAHNISLSYNSRKYLLIYLTLTFHRVSNFQKFALTDAVNLNIKGSDFPILTNEVENRLINLLIPSFSFNGPPLIVKDTTLLQFSSLFCSSLINELKLTLYNKISFEKEIYHFLYSALVQNYFQFFIEDRKLIDVAIIHNQLYATIVKLISPIAQHYGLSFSSTHLATLTLIVKKFILQNQSDSQNRKKVYLITNSSDAKVGYFKEVLKSHFHIEILDLVSCNELHLIKKEPYDLLICFTNKISSYLKYHHLSYIKVNFNLTELDLKRLASMGLSRAKHRISIERFQKELQKIPANQQRDYIISKYADYFI